MCSNEPAFFAIPLSDLEETHGKENNPEILAHHTYRVVKHLISDHHRLVKIVSCRQVFSLLLLDNGALMLFCPTIRSLHGSFIDTGGERVVDLAAGVSHFVYATDSGSVFSFGYSNEFGQLGDGTIWRYVSESDALVPNLALRLSKPKRIPGFGVESVVDALQQSDESENAVGEDTRSEERAACGQKRFVKGDISYDVQLEQKFPSKEPVRICAVACGSHHTLLLSAKHNAVYACGRGQCGQFGGKRKVPVQASFRSIRLLFGLPIRMVRAAGNHTLVLLSTGKLLAFGENICGQLGIGHSKEALAPTVASFLPENRGFAAAVKEGGMIAGVKRMEDAKMYSALRAAYASYESTFFPLRVERIDATLLPHEPFIVEVWTSATTTVALTSELNWLSCGLPLRPNNPKGTRKARLDGLGALGRPVLEKEDAFSFGYMHLSPAVRAAIQESGYILDGSCSGDGSTLEVPLPSEKRLECFCYPSSIVVKVPAPVTSTPNEATENAAPPPAVLFVQSCVVESLVQFGPALNKSDCGDEPRYHKIGLQDPCNLKESTTFIFRASADSADAMDELDDDSKMFLIPATISVFPFASICVLA